MRVSLPGMWANTECALRSSTDELACVCAYSFGELVDNLRVLKDGGCTMDEFFKLYVFDAKSEAKLADRVRKENYVCMRDQPQEEDA